MHALAYRLNAGWEVNGGGETFEPAKVYVHKQ